MPIETENGSLLTYEDYCQIPEDGRRHEIIEGRHVVSPAPRSYHQAISRNLILALGELQSSGRAEIFFAPIDVHLTPHDIVQPDIIAISAANAAILGDRKVDGPPDLVVEVLSPSTERRDRGSKRALYESARIMAYWIVEPDRKTIRQLVLTGEHYVEIVLDSGVLTSAAFPGYRVALDGIF